MWPPNQDCFLNVGGKKKSKGVASKNHWKFRFLCPSLINCVYGNTVLHCLWPVTHHSESGAVGTETMWPKKSKIFIIEPLTERGCPLLVQRIYLYFPSIIFTINNYLLPMSSLVDAFFFPPSNWCPWGMLNKIRMWVALVQIQWLSCVCILIFKKNSKQIFSGNTTCFFVANFYSTKYRTSF